MAKMTSLGKVTVTTAGTPVQLTSAISAAQLWAVKAAAGNTGKTYLGFSGMNKTTYSNVFWELGPGEVFPPPGFITGGNTINPSIVFVDADTNNNYLSGFILER